MQPALALDASSASAPNVSLRPLGHDDLAEIARWDEDLELVALYGGLPSEFAATGSGVRLAITAGDRLVGVIGLTGETWVMGSAELRILIGPPDQRGRRIGFKAITSLLSFVRAMTDLDFIYLRVLESNQRAVRCYEKCGFRRAGRLRVRSSPRYPRPPFEDDLLLMIWSGADAAADDGPARLPAAP